MNIISENGTKVHARHPNGVMGLCGAGDRCGSYPTSLAVDCKRCLKLLTTKEN